METREAPGCIYVECVLQDISITSLVRQTGRRKFYFKRMSTRIAPINAAGEIDEEGEVSLDPANPDLAAPGIPELIGEAENALGTSLEEMLDVVGEGSGHTVHAFGCADQCACVKRKHITLPDGSKVPDPGHLVMTGPPPSLNAVPGSDQPVAVIEKRVNIPGRGTFLITYEIRFYGSIRRFKGDCKPR